MRDVLSYSKPGQKEEAGGGDGGPDEEEAHKAQSERRAAIADGDYSKFLPPQIQHHPAYLSQLKDSDQKSRAIINALDHLRGGGDGEVTWGAPATLRPKEKKQEKQVSGEMDEQQNEEAPAAPQPPSIAEQYAQLAALSRGALLGPQDDTTLIRMEPFTPRFQQQPLDLSAMSDEEKSAWKSKREEVMSQSARLRRAPDAPPYNVEEHGLQAVLSKIGELRAQSRSMERSTDPSMEPSMDAEDQGDDDVECVD